MREREREREREVYLHSDRVLIKSYLASHVFAAERDSLRDLFLSNIYIQFYLVQEKTEVSDLGYSQKLFEVCLFYFQHQK